MGSGREMEQGREWLEDDNNAQGGVTTADKVHAVASIEGKYSS